MKKLMLKTAYLLSATCSVMIVGVRTDKKVGGRKAIVTTAIVFIAPLSSLAASPSPVMT